MQPKTHRFPGIAYVTRGKIDIYIQGMTQVLPIPFPPDVVRDLDLRDVQKLTLLLQTTIAQQKLPPGSLTLLLANDLLFAKQLISNEISAQGLEEQAFVDMVPYEDVGVQKIPFNNGIYITVANKEFYEGVIKSFEANNFTIPMILAAYIFSKEVNFATPLTPQSLALLIQKSGSLKQFNFLQKEVVLKTNDSEKPAEHHESTVDESKGNAPPPKSNRVFILVGAFIMLIGVLIAVYLWSSQSNQPVKKAEPTPTPVVTVAPPLVTPIPTLSDSTTSADVQGIKDILITLKFPGNSSQNAIIVEGALHDAGFSNITKEEISSVGTTSISFNNSLSDAVKNKVIESVSRVYEKVIIQNSNSYLTPVTIQLGE